MERRVTVEDVARRAGVSTATVSRTINGTAHVAQDTLERVRAAIDELAFHPNPSAQNLRRQRTRNIALVTPSIVNPFFPELVASVHPEAERRGYSLLLIDAEQPEREAARVARSRLVDGILLVASAHGRTAGDDAVGPHVPVVAFDREPAGASSAVVQCDNVAGSAAVVEHLLALGHTRVAHLRGPVGLDVAEQRAAGYRAAHAARGLAVDDALVVAGDFGEDSGFALTLALLDLPQPPTAVFAANDLMAIGVIAAGRQRGLQLPGDLSVAGFDGINLGRYTHPTLTTYVQPVAAIAERAVRILLDAVEAGPPAPPHPARRRPPTMRLPGELVVRGSTAPPRHRHADAEPDPEDDRR